MKNVTKKSVPAKKTAAKKNTVASRRTPRKTVAPAKVMSKTVPAPRVGFRAAVRDFFDRYFVFNGTSTRAQYWWAMLFVTAPLLLGLILSGVAIFIDAPLIIVALLGLMALFCVAVIIPYFALVSRRIHDAGFSAWIYFGPMIAVLLLSMFISDAAGDILGYIINGLEIAFALMPSKLENNPYRE